MHSTQTDTLHTPVLLKEVLEFFEGCSMPIFFEGTLGAAGHAQPILQAHDEITTYIGCDRDASALEIARTKLKPFHEKMLFVNHNFADLEEILEEHKIEQVNGFFLTWGCHLCS